MRRKRIWAGLLACLLCLGGCEPKGPELLPGFEGLMDKEMRRELADCIQTPEATASDGNTRILQFLANLAESFRICDYFKAVFLL